MEKRTFDGKFKLKQKYLYSLTIILKSISYNMLHSNKPKIFILIFLYFNYYFYNICTKRYFSEVDEISKFCTHIYLIPMKLNFCIQNL